MMNRSTSASNRPRRTSVNPFSAVLHNDISDDVPPSMSVAVPSNDHSLPTDSGDDIEDDEKSETSNTNHRVRPPRPSMSVVASKTSIAALNQRRRRRSSARFLHLSGNFHGADAEDEEKVHDDSALTSEAHGTLQEMYQTAIRMNAENKINTSNTWNLHIIDQMDTLLSLNDETEGENGREPSTSSTLDTLTAKEPKPRVNFTKASCTLDASVKIYSFRVDDVHLTSYKVLANLNRTQNNKQQDSLTQSQNIQDTVDDNDECRNEEPSQASKTSATGNTLETNIANINLNKLDSAFDIDPLFHKMSKTFDEGGAKGLLLANLGVSESSCHIVFDSSASESLDDTSEKRNSAKVHDDNVVEGQSLHRIPEGPMDVSALIAKLKSLLSEHDAEDDFDLENDSRRSNDIRNISLVPQLSALRAEHEKLVAAGCCGPDAAIALASTVGPKTPAGKVRHFHPDSEQEQEADYSIHQEAIERSQRKLNLSSDMRYSPATSLFQNRWSNDGSIQVNSTPQNHFSMDDGDYGSIGGFNHDDGIDDDHGFDTFIANSRFSDAGLTSTSCEPSSEESAFHTNHQSSSVSNFIDNIATGVTVLSGNDYEYFSSVNLSKGNSGNNMWAGASHWKRSISTKSKNLNESGPKKTTKTKARKITKRPMKNEPLVEFSSNSAPDLAFLWKDSSKRKNNSSATLLSKAMILKYTNDENILPIDLGYRNNGNIGSLQQLTTLFLRPKVSVLYSLGSSETNIMPYVSSEDSSGQKKTVDFTLPTTFDNFNGNDDEDNDGPGFDFGAMDGVDEYDEIIVPELDNVRKVNKVRVGYATVAKKVDVKRLKLDLWRELEARFELEMSTTRKNEEIEDFDCDDMEKSDGSNDVVTDFSDASEKHGALETVISFHDAVQTLGQQQRQGDITLPFYFICILHLANEKGLRLEQPDCSYSNDVDRSQQHQSLLSDFLIYQN